MCIRDSFRTFLDAQLLISAQTTADYAGALYGSAALDLDALIGIGGDGSARILARLAKAGDIPFIGVPKTIDNDLAETDFAIGYMSAVEVAVDAADRLQPCLLYTSRCV